MKRGINWKKWGSLAALCVYFSLLERMPTPIALMSLAVVCYLAFRGKGRSKR